MFKRNRAASFEMDMTTGSLLPKVLLFSGPLVLTGFLQLFYNAADIVVVGNFAGETALAAVSSTSSLINLLVNLFMGLSVGASVLVAACYGAGDAQRVQRAVHTSVTLALIGGVIVGLIGIFLGRPLLEMMGSPYDVIDQATVYVQIFFAGMPFNMLYFFGASILRAVGDTRRPLYYLTISGIVNVVLNLILVIPLHMGVAGVAIATIASQAVSMVLVLTCLIRSDTVIHLDVKKLGVGKAELIDILKVGLPAGLQSSLFSISNVLIQSSVNSFQSAAMAGNGAASNLEGFVYTAMNSIAQADITFASQNYGAGKYDRVRKTLWVCLGTVTVVGLILGGIVFGFRTQLLGIYNSNPEVIEYGIRRMSVILPTYFLCGIMDVIACQLRGIGISVMPMIVSLMGACVMRIVWIFTIFQIPAFHTMQVLYISYPISWLLTFVAHFICYSAIKKKKLPVH